MSVPDERLPGDLPVVDAATAAAEVPADGTVLVSGFGSVGYPKAVPEALAEREGLSLTVVSGGSVGPEVDEALVEAGAMARRYPFQARERVNEAVNAGEVAFADRHIASLGDDVRVGGLVDPEGAVAVVEAVAVGEDWLVLSTSVGQTPAFVAAADQLVVELNRAQPRELAAVHDIYRLAPPGERDPVPLTDAGERLADERLRFPREKLAAVVETDRRDEPYTFREPTAADEAVAANLRTFVEREVERSPVFTEALRVQFGVGSLGNALMGALAEANLGDRELVYFGEVVQDGLLDLLDAGELAAASATSLALSADGQERLFADLERYAEDVVLRPADVSNRGALVDRLGVLAVNSAVEVDLYGNVNSTHVGGTRVLNGVGGSGDFLRNAVCSVVATPATAADGEISRVRPLVTHADHSEHDVDVVVTDHGVADLRGLSPRERARRLVECAHPDFRESLRAYLARAGDEGHTPHDLDTALDPPGRD